MKLDKFQLSLKHQLMIGAALLITMLITRSHLVSHIADASWAIFLVAGFYLRTPAAFAVFMLAAFGIDWLVIDKGSVDSYCFTPAYPFLIPAYGALWISGHWLASRYNENVTILPRIALAIVVATSLCFVISNAGFYRFSNHFETMSIAEYVNSVIKYLPGYLFTTFYYTLFAIGVHTAMLYFYRDRKPLGVNS